MSEGEHIMVKIVDRPLKFAEFLAKLDTRFYFINPNMRDLCYGQDDPEIIANLYVDGMPHEVLMKNDNYINLVAELMKAWEKYSGCPQVTIHRNQFKSVR